MLDPLKFIGKELGSQTTYKEKGNEVVSLIKGSFIENLPALVDKLRFNFLKSNIIIH